MTSPLCVSICREDSTQIFLLSLGLVALIELEDAVMLDKELTPELVFPNDEVPETDFELFDFTFARAYD